MSPDEQVTLKSTACVAAGFAILTALMTYPLIRIDLPRNETLALRLRQTRATRSWHWAIPELEIWAR